MKYVIFEAAIEKTSDLYWADQKKRFECKCPLCGTSFIVDISYEGSSTNA